MSHNRHNLRAIIWQYLFKIDQSLVESGDSVIVLEADFSSNLVQYLLYKAVMISPTSKSPPLVWIKRNKNTPSGRKKSRTNPSTKRCSRGDSLSAIVDVHLKYFATKVRLHLPINVANNQ